MVEYTQEMFEELVLDYGEPFVVLESDRQYTVHGREGYEFIERGDEEFVKVEGLQDEEWVVAEFPLDAVEHIHTHKEV